MSAATEGKSETGESGWSHVSAAELIEAARDESKGIVIWASADSWHVTCTPWADRGLAAEIDRRRAEVEPELHCQRPTAAEYAQWAEMQGSYRPE